MIYLELFLTFFMIGAFTFGGGYAMLPLISEEATSRGWATMEELTNFVAISESTPGPFAVNIATFIGADQGREYMGQFGGVIGSMCATLGVVLPSYIVILIVATCYQKFNSSKIVKGVMSGLRPAAIGLIGSAVINMGESVLFPNGIAWSVFATPAFIFSAALAAIMFFVVMKFKKVSPVWIVAISAVVGIAAGYILDAFGIDFLA